MTLTEITQLAFIPIVYVASYFLVRPNFAAWAEPERGFNVFDGRWNRIFTAGGIAATLVTVILLMFTPLNAVTALTLGITSGFLLMGAYTDSVTHKVPEEFSKMAILVSMVLGLGALVYNGFTINQGTQKFYDPPLFYLPGEWYYYLAGGIVVMLLGFLVWVRIAGAIGLISILLSVSGLWIAIYVLMEQATYFLTTTPVVSLIDSYGIASILVYGVPSILAVLFAAVAFQLGSDGKMGGADTAAMYAAAWTFAPVIGGIVMGVGVVIAAFLQLFLHLFAKPLKLSGKQREVSYDPLVYFFKKVFWKMSHKEGVPPKTYTAIALPFLPTLNISTVVTMIVYLSLVAPSVA